MLFEAPLGDSGDSLAQTVLLCLPSAQSGRLEYFQERILMSHTRHPAEFTIRRLFSYSGTTQADPLSKTVQLSLNPGSSIEISGATATVNLAPSALSLSNQERYLVSRAITNTLTQWGDIRYVNVLINNRQPGIDTAATLPLGSLGKTEDGNVAALWDTVSSVPSSQNNPYSGMATLYYPVNAGRGVASETRLVTAQSRSLEHIALALLEALSVMPSNLPNTLPLPDLNAMMTQPPVVEETAGSTGRLVRLNFRENLNEALIASGIPRSVMMASLTYTLTTFLPYTAGVSVTIGSELISALVPAGLYEGAGEQILFENGVMQRSFFSRFLLDNCSLYFANAQGSLTLTQRPIPYYQAHNPRYLMSQLMAGPMNTDSVAGLSPVLPVDLKEADLLGITRQNETALVHFSANLRIHASNYSPQQELLMVYAMVNTLTRQRDIKQACFFIDSQQEGVFTNEIDVAGVFLRNEGIIQK